MPLSGGIIRLLAATVMTVCWCLIGIACHPKGLAALVADGAVWVREFKGSGWMYPSVTAGLNENVWVAGGFAGKSFMEPPDRSRFTDGFEMNSILIQFDILGKPLRSVVWPSSERNECVAIETDRDGNIFLIGAFAGTLDLDPGPQGDQHSSNHPWMDAYVLKLGIEGGYQWGQSWGGTAYDIAVDDAGNAIVLGGSPESVEFNLTEGNHGRVAIAGPDHFFVARLGPDGKQQWMRTWGAEPQDAQSCAVAVNALGKIFIAGSFRGPADFDPGPGVDLRGSGSSLGTFLMEFGPEGDLDFARTWDGGMPSDIALDRAGNVYMTGIWSGEVDFDPGPGADEHTSSLGNTDGFLSKFDPSGEFLWVKVWNAEGPIDKVKVVASAIALDSNDGVWVAGYYCGKVDFDPGPGVCYRDLIGKSDVFLSCFDNDGDFRFVRTVGRKGFILETQSVACDPMGYVYLVGLRDSFFLVKYPPFLISSPN